MRARPRTWRQLAGQQRRVDDDDARQWPIWLMLIGLFAMIVAFWWVASAVLVTYWVVVRLFCAFAFAGNLVFGRWVERVFGMSRSYWFMFNLLAIGPFLFCVLFTVNALFTSDERAFIVREPISGLGLKNYWVEHGTLPAIATADPGDAVAMEPPAAGNDRQFSVLRLSKGALGLVVLGWSEPTYVPPPR